MTKLSSFYLDLLRVIAAFGVLLNHCNFTFFSNHKFLDGHYGHKFVILFFVLSGHLIAYSSLEKRKDFGVYIVDRFSRLYSVIIPALIITYCLDGLGAYLQPNYYNQFHIKDHQFYRVLMVTLNLHQIWNFCFMPSTNDPFWSIGYEVWYYVIFGFALFIQNKKWMFISILICFGIVGIKILVLMPAWLMGVGVYFLRKIKIRPAYAFLGFVSSLLVILYLTIFIISPLIPYLVIFGTKQPLYFSNNFLFDYLYAFVLALNLFFLFNLPYHNFKPGKFGTMVKYFASITFTLYLLHYPLIVFFAGTIKYDHDNYLHLYGVITLILLIVAVISWFTELKRNVVKAYMHFYYLKLNRVLKSYLFKKTDYISD